MAEPAPSATIAVPGYAVGERIGAGGFGEVFRARHELMGRDVAIKILHAKYSAHPEAVARFVAEARAVARISHPAIVDVFDFGRLADGRHYCVMELVRGQTLRDVLRERDRLPLAEALPILGAIAEAVDAAHGAGIAHRDLKPDNVFVLPDGSIKLIDFGLAKLMSEDAPAVTETGAVFGTPLYMSPEQCRGKATDTRTDAYSFGVLAYHLLTGAPPFTGEALEIALHHLNDQPEPPSARCAELDARVDRVVLALMAKDPDARPAPLAPAIAAIAGDADLPAAPRTPRARRWPYLVGALALTGAVAAALIVRAQRAHDAVAAPARSCAPAAERLTGIWDMPTRAVVQARLALVRRPDAAGTWHAVAADLDTYATRWSAQWEATCTEDASVDPLLHAQRETCLENALLDLRGITSSLATDDAAAFTAGWNGVFMQASLADCANDRAVRAQMPAPPVENRAKVAELMMGIHRARLELRKVYNVLQPGNTDPLLAQLDTLGTELEKLRASGANIAWWLRASYLQGEAANNPLRRKAARLAVQSAITHAEASRDDALLAWNYDTLARLELDAANTDAADAALAKADAALARSGDAELPATWLRGTHARADMVRGRLDEAVARVPPGLVIGPDFTMRPEVVLRAGRTAQAVAEMRELIAQQREKLGEHHWLVAQLHAELAVALERAGDLEAALDENATALATFRAVNASNARITPVWTHRLDLAVKLGPAGETRAIEAATQSSGAPVPWFDVARLAFDRGQVETMRFALARITDVPPGIAEWVEDLRAVDDAIAGDREGLARHSHDPPVGRSVASDRVLTGPWFLAILDASAGKKASAEARLAKLARYSTSTDPNLTMRAQTNDGMVLDALGRYRDAVVLFQKARAQPNWTRGQPLAALDAWLGASLIAAGDMKRAIGPLEESLDVIQSCCRGFSWMIADVELGLARALWDTGGDRHRARALATAARDHFARIVTRGERLTTPGMTHEGAVRWLAEHTEEQAAEPLVPRASLTGCPAPANPSAPGKHVIYLNADGVTLTRSPINDARANTSSLLSVTDRAEVPPFLAGTPDRTAAIARLAAALQAALAPYSVSVVTTRPRRGDYRMIVLGGTPTVVGAAEGTRSLSRFDCEDHQENGIDLVFDAGPANSTYVASMLSDIGSLIGLAPSAESDDCMCRSAPTCGMTVRCTFGIVPVTDGACGRTEQDEPAMLKAALGCR